MKKIISIILVLLLMATGCGSQETEEARKEKTRQEEARKEKTRQEEMHKEEIRQELLEEKNLQASQETEGKDVNTVEEKGSENNNPVKENNEKDSLPINDDSDEYIVPSIENGVLKGQLTLQGTDPGLGLLLEERTIVGPYEVKQIIFNQEESVLKYLPRAVLTYYFEGQLSLKEKLSGQLALEIRIDPTTLYYEDERDLAWVDVLEVLSLDGEINPRDKTEDTYPDQYYKEVIYHLSASMNIPIRENIQDTEIYMAGGVFTEAVDELLYRGYAFKMGEDRYHIVREE